MFFFKKRTQQLISHSYAGKKRRGGSFTLKSTIFTCEWLKEKGNNAYTNVSIHVYTYT